MAQARSSEARRHRKALQRLAPNAEGPRLRTEKNNQETRKAGTLAVREELKSASADCGLRNAESGKANQEARN